MKQHYTVNKACKMPYFITILQSEKNIEMGCETFYKENSVRALTLRKGNGKKTLIRTNI